MGLIRMSYDDYDRLESILKSCNYSTGTPSWVPTLEEINKYIIANPLKYGPFAIWILLQNDDGLTEDQLQAKKMLRKFVYNLYELQD